MALENNLQTKLRMSGSPIPDIRHSATFIDILRRTNSNDLQSPQEVTTLFSPMMLPPLSYEAQPTTTSSDNESDEILLSLASTPGPTSEGLNSFYFYKVCVVKFSLLYTSDCKSDVTSLFLNRKKKK